MHQQADSPLICQHPRLYAIKCDIEKVSTYNLFLSFKIERKRERETEIEKHVGPTM